MAQQTAMQKLLTNLESIGITIPLGVQMVYLKIEKEQISKAWDDGNYQYFCSVRTNEDFDNGYEYYEEQYKSE
jgi:hypothetical protein